MPLEPGATIGDYTIIALLGAGGMGQVYKVQNLLSNRIEAMKVLVPDLRSQSELAERFLREMQMHASLTHPNIAAMHTAMRLDNQLVMLMEFVEGTTLEDRLREGNLALDESMDYARQMLSALAYAHKQGVVHRDVKPANVMVTPDGIIKLMDFGLAAGVADKRLTRAGTIVGSLYYMSPEQVRGETCSPQTDIYSAGLTLYEMLTGVRGIRGETEFALMNAQLTELPETPTHLNPAIPASLSAIVLRSVAKNPADRFGSASAFRDALEVTGKPPGASADLDATRVVTPPAALVPVATPPPPSVAEPAPIPPPPAAPKSRTLIVALVIVVLLVAGVVAYRSLAVSPSTPPPATTVAVATPAAAIPATPEPTTSPAPEPEKAVEHPEKAAIAKETPPPSPAKATPAPAPATPAPATVAAPEPTPPAEEADQPEPAIAPARREAARREVAAVLSQLDAAYATKDFNKLAALWPGGTPDERGRWVVFYGQFRSVAFTMRLLGDPTTLGSEAVIRYHFERTRNKGPAERILIVHMSRTAGGWVITRINFTPIGAK